MISRRRRLLATAAAVVVLCAARPAAAEEPTPAPEVTEPIRILGPSELRTEGVNLRLPPGYFFPEPDYDKLDAEVIRLQDAETRLTAENDSLRQSADEPDFGWRWVAGITISAFVAGILIEHWAF